MIHKILDFLNTAGAIAMNGFHAAHDNKFKSEMASDIVTETDLAISAEFKKFCADNFSDIDYIIVDEESVKELGTSPFAEIEKHEWQFVIDPIDGTLMYANSIPTFGVSIGILHNGKPHSGAIFAPALNELIYFDGTDGWWVKNNQKTKLEKYESNPKQFISFAGTWRDFERTLQPKLNFGSCVVSELYLATGRSCAYYFSQSLWDIAGSWALLEHIGLEFINFNTGEKLESIGSNVFDDKLRIRDLHIVCSPGDFEQYKSYVRS